MSLYRQCLFVRHHFGPLSRPPSSSVNLNEYRYRSNKETDRDINNRRKG